MTDPASAQNAWYLDIQGKKFGPYNSAQIQTLIQQGQILAQDKITTPSWNGRWVTLQDFTQQVSRRTPPPVAERQESPAPEALSVPPRPDEQTLTNLTSPRLVKGVEQHNPIEDLFDIVQAARERKPVKATAHITMPEVVGSGDTGIPKIWLQIGGAILLIATGVWAGKAYFAPEPEPTVAAPASIRSGGRPLTSPAAHPPGTTPAAAVSAAETNAAVPAPGLTPRPRLSLARPSTPPTAMDNSTREMEREREREMEKDRERESDRGDSEREKELERERERERDRDTRRESPQNEQNRENAPANEQGQELPQGGTPANPQNPGEIQNPPSF